VLAMAAEVVVTGIESENGWQTAAEAIRKIPRPAGSVGPEVEMSLDGPMAGP